MTYPILVLFLLICSAEALKLRKLLQKHYSMISEFGNLRVLKLRVRKISEWQTTVSAWDVCHCASIPKYGI